MKSLVRNFEHKMDKGILFFKVVGNVLMQYIHINKIYMSSYDDSLIHHQAGHKRVSSPDKISN